MTALPATHAVRPSQRARSIEISEIVRISERAAQLRADGLDIISFGTGEPDMPTPRFIIDAAHDAARRGETRYPPTAGTAQLRAAIADNEGVGPDHVIISTGAKQVIANAMLATLDAGDEVIIPAPYWTTYPDIVKLCEGVPVIVQQDMGAGFKLLPDALERAITPRTRWLILNSPSNPAGAVYSAQELRQLACVLERHPNVGVIFDEIYRQLSYVPFASLTLSAPFLKDRLLIVNGVSKAWSMTGWRVGWGIGPAKLIEGMIAIQGQITSGASSISQAAALAAVTGDEATLARRRAVFKDRRDRIVGSLNAISGVECVLPEGAFYAFPDLRAFLTLQGGPFESDAALCNWLLDTAGVAVIPGRAFGMPGAARLSYAYSEQDLDEGVSRMASALESVWS